MDEFTELAGYRRDPCISVYIPTHRSGKETSEGQDQILFKNNLQRAGKWLEKKGLKSDEREEILRPGFALLEDVMFWNKQEQGLAVFMAPGFFRKRKLPVSVAEKFFTGRSFYLLPLLPVLTGRQFFLLVFSKEGATFYLGNAFGMRKVPVKGLPYGMDDVIHFEEKTAEKTFRRADGSVSANYHGHGPGLADEKGYITEYLKEVDDTLMKEVLGRRKLPLLLSAVDYLVSIYRRVNHYEYLSEEAITGNYEDENPDSLFRKAREILTPYFEEPVQKAIDNFYNYSDSGRVSSDPVVVIPASYYGRVQDLFIQKDVSLWGTFREEENRLRIYEKKQADNDCLLNQAGIRTILKGGNAYVLEKDRMPEGRIAAAFMRYEL